MYYKQILEAKELAIALPQSYGADDQSPAFLEYYVPNEGEGKTAATIALVQGGDVTHETAGTTVAGKDAIGTAGVIDSSAGTADTVGEYCNVVNATQAWKAICLCKPETPMANVLAKSEASCMLQNGLVFYLDTTVTDTTYIHSYPIIGESFENQGIAGRKSEVADQCVNRFHMCQFFQNFTTAANLYLYVFKQGDATSTKVFTKALTDNTHMDIGNVAQPDVPFYTAPEGYSLVVDIRTDLQSTAPTLITVLGSTVVRKNNRRVVRLPHVAV